MFHGYPLGQWVVTQRHRRATLSPDRQRRLEELPGWTWDSADSQQYVEQHGHASVPYTYTVDGDKLGTWVHRQHRLYAKKKLDPDRQRRLRT